MILSFSLRLTVDDKNQKKKIKIGKNKWYITILSVLNEHPVYDNIAMETNMVSEVVTGDI